MSHAWYLTKLSINSNILNTVNKTASLVILRSFAASAKPTGGPVHLEQVVDDLKKRGLKEGDSYTAPNLFKLFQVEQDLNINVAKLRREYTKLVRTIHPDKFVNSGKDTQNKVLDLSALINEAYGTLRHPYKRAKYMVSLSMNLSESDLEAKLDRLQIDDKFLARMMEYREQVELDRDMDRLTRTSLEIEYEIVDLLDLIRQDLKNQNQESLLEKLGKLKFLGNLHVKLAEKTSGFSSF